MESVITTVIAGLLVAFLASWFGWAGNAPVTIVGGGKIRRTGKKMIIVSFFVIAVGMYFVKTEPHYGYPILILGAILLFLGKVIAWYQKI